MTTTDSTETNSTLENQNVSPGAQLRRAREALGLSQKQVAERLHLRLSSIAALEEDGIEPDISTTFTKGYVRLYARLVNLPVEGLLADFDKLHIKDKTPTKLQSFSHRVEREANDSRWNMVTYVVVLVVISCMGYWAYDQHKSSFLDFATDAAEQVRSSFDSVGSNDQPTNDNGANDDSSDSLDGDVSPQPYDDKQSSNDQVIVSQNSDKISEESAQALQVEPEIGHSNIDNVEESNESSDPKISTTTTYNDDATALDASAVLPDTRSATTQEQVTSQEQETSTISDPQSPLEESINQTTEVDLGALAGGIEYITNADGTVDVSFTFARDCWLRVRDSEGKTMALGTKSAGRVMNVSGTPPISINLCPPERVSIVFGGRLVDLSNFERGSPIKFELPLVSE